MCTHSICEHIHVQVYTMFAEHTHGRHICMPTQYTQHDMYIWTYIFPTFFNHLAALCSSTRDVQSLTGSPQHQKAAGTSRSHRKACDHRPGHRTDPPKAKQPVVCHMGPCGHSVGDTVISFREVYNNIFPTGTVSHLKSRHDNQTDGYQKVSSAARQRAVPGWACHLCLSLLPSAPVHRGRVK